MLKLAIPEQAPESVPADEARPAQVERWLAALPALDLVRNLERIHARLARLNRAPAKAQIRGRLLELYRRPAAEITRQLQSRPMGRGLPLAGNIRPTADRLHDAWLELAFGYKALIVDLARDVDGKASRDHMALAIHRCLRHLTYYLLQCYEFYAPAPEGSWLEIHQLYRYARSLRLQDRVIEDVLNRASAGTPIEHAYLQAVLVGLSNPYRLANARIGDVDAYLDRWAGLAQLEAIPVTNQRRCRFLVHFHRDRPAIPCSGEAPAGARDAMLILNTRPLVHRVHLELTGLKAGITPEGDAATSGPAARELLQHLVVSWGVIPKRRFSRLDAGESCRLVVGVGAVNALVNGGRPFRPSAAPPPAIPAPRGPAAIPPAGDLGAACDLINEGAGGVSIAVLEIGDCRLRVGDLVATGRGAAWSFGLIRWLRAADHPARVLAGVQILAPGAVPAAAKPVQRTAGDGELPALLLPAVPALEQPVSLITGPGLFRAQRNLFLETPEGLRMIRAAQLLEHSPCLDWFTFDELDL